MQVMQALQVPASQNLLSFELGHERALAFQACLFPLQSSFARLTLVCCCDFGCDSWSHVDQMVKVRTLHRGEERLVLQTTHCVLRRISQALSGHLLAHKHPCQACNHVVQQCAFSSESMSLLTSGCILAS